MYVRDQYSGCTLWSQIILQHHQCCRCCTYVLPLQHYTKYHTKNESIYGVQLQHISYILHFLILFLHTVYTYICTYFTATNYIKNPNIGRATFKIMLQSFYKKGKAGEINQLSPVHCSVTIRNGSKYLNDIIVSLQGNHYSDSIKYP